MDDELSLTLINQNVAYSRLGAIPTEVNPCYELQQRVNIDRSATKGVKQTSTNEASNSRAVLITMIVVLLLFTLTSIALSAVTFSRMTSEQSKLARQQDKTEDTLKSMLTHINSTQNKDTGPERQYECGPDLWWQVAYLDMTDPSQQCPSAWREYNTSGVKACGRPANSTGSCAAEFYFTNHQYSRVCGRIIGYQVASPDAFNQFDDFKEYNGRGLDGVIISHGAQQGYIWSYAAGVTERSPRETKSICPCATVAGLQPPTNIGNNHYCESGNPNNTFEHGRLYSNDPLWDGQQCEGTCCTGTKSPPWFSVQLPAPTTDIIEVSICCDEDTMNEDTPVELIEIYVQ